MSGATADIGLVGLAVMGQNLVLNMDDHGFTVGEVLVHDLTAATAVCVIAGKG